MLLLLILLAAAVTVLAADTTSTTTYRLLSTEPTQRRTAENDDFQSLNVYLEQTRLFLNETVVEIPAAGATLFLTLSDLTCFDMSLRDIILDYNEATPASFVVYFAVEGLQLSCELDYEYDYSFFNGAGRAVMESSTNDESFVRTNTAIIVQPTSAAPLTMVNLTDCMANISLSNLVFDGDGLGLVASVLNLMQEELIGTVQTQISSYLCQSLRTMMNEDVNRMMQTVGNRVFNHTSNNETDETTEEPASSGWLYNHINPVVETMIQAAGTYLSDDDQGTSEADLNINRVIRDYILLPSAVNVTHNDTTGLAIDFNASSSTGFPTLLQAATLIGNVTLTLASMEIQGLDTFTRFDPFQFYNATHGANESDPGPIVFGTTVALEQILVSVGIDLLIQSTTTASAQLRESIIIDIPIHDLAQEEDSVSLSMVVSLDMDENQLLQLPLGTLLLTKVNDVASCLLQTIRKLEILQLSVGTEANVTLVLPDSTPIVVRGLQSRGFQRLLTTMSNLVYDMYQPAIQDSLPELLQTTVVDFVNEAMQSFWDDNAVCYNNNSAVSQDETSSDIIDFRDLLLPPEQAKALGGRGTSPYGALAPFAMEFVNTQLLAIDPETGMATYINDVVIGPLTRLLSGTRGRLAWNDTLINLDSGTFQLGVVESQVQFQVSNIRMENLDTFGPPLMILNPLAGDAPMLNSSATLAASPTFNRSVQAAAEFFFAVSAKGKQACEN
jgi:hypothetical protein